MKTKFYEFGQNNSGGIFDVDENVCHRVIIEAENEAQAQTIFEPMIEYQSYSCPCCGDRWSIDSPDTIDIEKIKKQGYQVMIFESRKNSEKTWFERYGKYPRLEEPAWKTQYESKSFVGKVYFEDLEQYCQFMADEYGWTSPDSRIFYLDGTKKEIFRQESV